MEAIALMKKKNGDVWLGHAFVDLKSRSHMYKPYYVLFCSFQDSKDANPIRVAQVSINIVLV